MRRHLAPDGDRLRSCEGSRVQFTHERESLSTCAPITWELGKSRAIAGRGGKGKRAKGDIYPAQRDMQNMSL